MQSLPSLGEEQPYDRVKTYLEDFKAWRTGARPLAHRDFEKPFRCNISMKDWFKLNKDLNLDESDDRYPRFSYIASTSSLIVQCTTTPVHETMIDFLGNYLPSKLSENARVATGRKIPMLKGKHAGLGKIPDISIQEKQPGRSRQTKWVLEVGFSETYDELLEDVQLWLTGRESEVVYCVLVKITEDPTHNCPLRDVSDEEIRGRELKSAETISEEDFMGEEYGPVFYDGDRWVGQIKEVFWEVWRLNPGTGKPELVGEREFLVPKSNSAPKIPLDEFLSSPSACGQVSPDWDQFRALLKEDIRTLAIERYQSWYWKRAKAEDDKTTDPDFE
jgi:hypothetical protein